MSYKCEMLADSIATNGKRMTTMLICFSRYVLAEIRTHRVILEDDEVEMYFRGMDDAGRLLSMNSTSSRAIPISKMIQKIKEDPFIPVFTGAQKGMQGTDESENEALQEAAQTLWITARNNAISVAEELLKIGVHKQQCNRLLEPFGWVELIVSATEWDNFFDLRTNTQAAPEIYTIACMMQKCMQQSNPTILDIGEWHLPLICQEDRDSFSVADLRRISSGRVARVSYLTHLGCPDPTKDMKLHDDLVSNKHMSPFEHITTPAPYASFASGNLLGFTQYRKMLE